MLRTQMEELSKRRRAKKTRLRNGGSLSVQEAEDLVPHIQRGCGSQALPRTPYLRRMIDFWAELRALRRLISA
jgi:hypothetical protein